MPDPILYPKAIWKPLLNHSATGTLEQRNLIVIHITSGASAMSAIWTFVGSTSPNRISSHFVIDRDGTVYQLVDLRDTAWHSSTVNSRSIGIEHAAIPHALMVTDAQYTASAELVAWLCTQLKIPCDRKHVLGHFEASPVDKHTQCPEGAMSVDKLVQMAGQVQGLK